MSVSSSEEEEEGLTNEEMPMEIAITLDRMVYFVGQDIGGTVNIINEHRRKMRGIRLTLKCRGEVFWIDQKGKNINDTNFLHVEKYIVGDGHLAYLEPGQHVFSFSISLTSKTDLPSAMEFPKGNIRYLLKAEVDWPWASVQGHERLINVVNVCNLRQHRESLQPASFTETFKIGFLRKSINLSGRLEKIAYVPGEEILIDVEINNTSNRKILAWFLRLTEIVDYLSSEGKRCVTKHILVENVYEEIPAWYDLMLQSVPILVPPIPQSGRTPCEFLKVNYEVSIAVQIGATIKTAECGIFIGTLPTKNTYRRFRRGVPPLKNVCKWPFEDIANLPYGAPLYMPDRPDIFFVPSVAEVDPDFMLQYISFTFDNEMALKMLEENEESSDEETFADDASDAMSAFSL